MEDLGRYRAKRDFRRTPEPRGEKIAPAKFPRFVVQWHDATRLHYDLRLEVDGVFKSWAVTRGPSLDPKDKRLAVEVEDHPLDYGDFEGTIPEGLYGAGTVMVWDRGYWTPNGGESALESLHAGELKFVMLGEKLKGEWVLVRLKTDRTGAGRVNWLLIKHRDSWAKPGDNDALLKRSKSVASGRTMKEIAAGKGPEPEPFIGAAVLAVPRTVRTRGHRAGKVAPVKAAAGRVLGVAISNPDKVLWPADERPAVTKLALAEYLATVGPWMLAHIAGRPCSIVRAPDGITKNQFFQRHPLHGSEQGGEDEPYLQIDSITELIEMAQLAAVEFHPWNNTPGLPLVPGRLVFDLDPAPEVAFAEVVTAAQELRERLGALGLVPFCKTTGGKGLHVVVPLKAEPGSKLGWDEAKMFAEAVSREMAADSPGRFVTTMSKRKRQGKIFIDYLRNDRTATAVAPLSPRARPGATVSMPLSWEQARKDLDPRRFTIHTVPRLMASSEVWSSYGRSARTLSSAIRKLVA